MSKVKYLYADAMKVATEIELALVNACQRVVTAGSLRRMKPQVGDVEIVYIPTYGQEPTPGDMFASPMQVNFADRILDNLCRDGVLAPRLNVNGSKVWGEKNKLAVHVASGIPVDLFSTSSRNWWNYLVCRTGGAETNRQICMAANARGWRWNPYEDGFVGLDPDGKPTETRSPTMTSEEQVFEFVGFKYQEPKDRI